MAIKKRELYKFLGIKQNASPDEIKAAHRKMVKETHPDTGGTEEEFRQVQTAYLVLSNPKRRAKYDEDGTIEEVVDNALVPPLNVINTILQGFLDEAVKHPLDSSGRVHVPSDVIELLRGEINRNIAEIEQQFPKLQQEIKVLNLLAKRFTSKKVGVPAYVSRMVEDKCNNVEKRVRNMRDIIEASKKALEMLKDQAFQTDLQQQQVTLVGNMLYYTS